MNVADLPDALRHLGVGPDQLWVQGFSQGPPPESTMVLTSGGQGWRAVVYERGETTVYGEFPDEDSACQWLLSYHTRPPAPAPRRVTAAEEQRARQLAEEDRADYERALSERRDAESAGE